MRILAPKLGQVFSECREVMSFACCEAQTATWFSNSEAQSKLNVYDPFRFCGHLFGCLLRSCGRRPAEWPCLAVDCIEEIGRQVIKEIRGSCDATGKPCGT
eukprot:TRINITY_DN3501_c0_g1_i2.p1 TRINITY_DN3501_c0_g1~~TRINITY_DN3501_c0_g1_i2.p1  ORF type:complete len:101 (-),score=3.31 TRINITY_DN3501_c0_g1_i2:258-560(-)